MYMYIYVVGTLGHQRGGKGAEERVDRAPERARLTRVTRHPTHVHARAHLSFHTRADPRGAHASYRVCRVGKADSPYI